ncbi:hypothetical protein GCM10022276_28970 [Sphingomonas limnosediminicola]|uniref:Uncharacterized protein n=1 Tax=Sphingomonas limnosediminicola TaxID=940133 RepID=A0ABP7LXK6_9SPHN
MTRHVEFRPGLGFAPIEQERAPAHARHCTCERDLLIEIEDAGRIDERRNEDGRRSVAAVVAQAGTVNARRFRLCCGTRATRRALISAQPNEGFARDLSVRLAYAPYQFEKEREWAWRLAVRRFMLQRTNLR